MYEEAFINNFYIDNIISNFQIISNLNHNIQQNSFNFNQQNLSLNKMFNYLEIINENYLFFDKKYGFKSEIEMVETMSQIHEDGKLSEEEIEKMLIDLEKEYDNTF